jgi:hypothetical protein
MTDGVCKAELYLCVQQLAMLERGCKNVAKKGWDPKVRARKGKTWFVLNVFIECLKMYMKKLKKIRKGMEAHVEEFAPNLHVEVDEWDPMFKDAAQALLEGDSKSTQKPQI